MATRPVLDLSNAKTLGNLSREAHRVPLRDAATLATDPAQTLREQGFAAVPFEATIAIDQGGDTWRRTFAEAAGNAVGRLVGARQVSLQIQEIVVRRGQGSGADGPVTVCHSDFTPGSAARKVARIDPRLLQRRFAIYNVWWLAGEPPQDAPLALCDSRTIAPADAVTGNAIAFDAHGKRQDFGEIALFRYNPRQRWSWYPDLTTDRLLVFAAHDSDPRFASQVPHSAFLNRGCPSEVPTRVSVEARCFAYW